MEVQQLGKILGDHSFSAPLSDSTLAEIGEIASLVCYPAGSMIFREGSSNPNLMLIRHGRVGLDINVPGRGPVRILTLGPGDMVAWSALFGTGEMTTSATALENTELITCCGKRLLELSQSNHEIGYQFMHRMATALANRLVATRLQLLDLFCDQSPAMALESKVPCDDT